MTRCFLLVLLFGLLMPSFAQAQLFGKFEKKISSEYVPESACLVAVTFPKRISEDPTFDDLPREILTAWGKKEFGFDPMLIEQVTFILKQIDSINTDAAEEVREILVAAMEFGAQSLLSEMSATMDPNDPVERATVEYARRITDKYQKKFAPVVKGSQLSITIREEILALPFVAGLIGSYTEAAQ